MMNHKLGTLMLGACLAFGTAVAQDATTQSGNSVPNEQQREAWKAQRQQKMEQRRQEMTQFLGLTDAQQEQLKALHAERKQKMEQLANTPLTRDQFREQSRELHEGFKARRDQILTAEQKQKLEQFKQNHRGRRGKFGKRGGFHGGMGEGTRGPGQN